MRAGLRNPCCHRLLEPCLATAAATAVAAVTVAAVVDAAAA